MTLLFDFMETCGSQQTGRFLKRLEYQNTLPAYWETCVQLKKKQWEPDMEQWTDAKLGKEYIKGILSSSLFNLYVGYIMRIVGLDESQICRWYRPNGRNQRGTEEPLYEGERREWKSWLKTPHSKNEDHGIHSHHFMANRWENNRNSDRLYFPGLWRWLLQPWN